MPTDPTTAVIDCVRRSAAYHRLCHRFADPQPSAEWVEGDLAYIVFDLHPTHTEPSLAPLALFVVHRHQLQVVLVRLITPHANVTAADIVDLDPYQERVLNVPDRPA